MFNPFLINELDWSLRKFVSISLQIVKLMVLWSSCPLPGFMTLGERSVLEAYFYLKRHIGYHILQLYLPAYLLVVVSWVSFFLNRESTSDRVTLGKTFSSFQLFAFPNLLFSSLLRFSPFPPLQPTTFIITTWDSWLIKRRDWKSGHRSSPHTSPTVSR